MFDRDVVPSDMIEQWLTVSGVPLPGHLRRPPPVTRSLSRAAASPETPILASQLPLLLCADFSDHGPWEALCAEATARLALRTYDEMPVALELASNLRFADPALDAVLP